MTSLATGAVLPDCSVQPLAHPEFDPEYTERCYEDNLRFITEEYFRARLIDAGNIPLHELGQRAIILLPNHSGMGLSWDNIILDFLCYDLLKQRLGDGRLAVWHKMVRLVDPLLISHSVITPFMMGNWWRKIGCMPASFANFEQAVKDKRLICLSPEGVGGIAKGFHRRYRLQRYSSSFMALARKHNALIVPVSVVNAEYIRPFNYSSDLVNKLGRKLGVPFVPLGLGALQFLFPATFLTPFPAKLTYVVHAPLEYPPLAVMPDALALRQETDLLQARQQQQLDEAVRRYHRPFEMRSWFSHFWASSQKRMFLPFFWHELFLQSAQLPPLLGVLYKIPLAYPLISLTKWLLGKALPGKALPLYAAKRHDIQPTQAEGKS